MISPSARQPWALGWANSSYSAKRGRPGTAAKSLPRRDRSIPARLVVTSRASAMQNSTSRTTATERDDNARAEPERDRR